MIKKLSILLTLVLVAVCLASCSKPSPLESNPHNAGNAFPSFAKLDPESLKPDEYYTSLRQGESSIARYIETPYGMYNLGTDRYIYYSENGNTKYIKLCNRPDCNHNTADCNAYTGANHIGYYKDNIYYIGGSSINCMDIDGTNHKTVKSLYEGSDNNVGYFHNGYYYYVITRGGTIGTLGNVDNNLYRVKIDDNSKPEILLTDDIVLDINMFFVTKDYIFLTIYNFDAIPSCYLYKFSCETKQLAKITDSWSGFGTVYFNNNYGYCYRANEGIYRYTVDTDEIKLVKDIKFDNDGYCATKFYPDYIYLIHNNNEDPRDSQKRERVLYIYDWEFNLLNSIEFNYIPTKKIGGFVTVVGDYILFASNWDNNPDYYIDKSEIGTCNLMFHKIED